MITVLVCGATTTFIITKIAEDRGYPVLSKVIPTIVGSGFALWFLWYLILLFT